MRDDDALVRHASEQRSDEQPLLDQLRRDEQMRDQIGVERALRQISDDEWRSMRDALSARIEQTRSTLAREIYDDALLPLLSNPGEIEQTWERATLSQQRTMLAAAIERVEIAPVGQSGNKWNPERVHVIWR